MRAAPVEGAANDALTRLVARALGVAPTSVRLSHGGQSRLKRLEIDGLDEAEVRARLSSPAA